MLTVIYGLFLGWTASRFIDIPDFTVTGYMIVGLIGGFIGTYGGAFVIGLIADDEYMAALMDGKHDLLAETFILSLIVTVVLLGIVKLFRA